MDEKFIDVLLGRNYKRLDVLASFMDIETFYNKCYSNFGKILDSNSEILEELNNVDSKVFPFTRSLDELCFTDYIKALRNEFYISFIVDLVNYEIIKIDTTSEINMNIIKEKIIIVSSQNSEELYQLKYIDELFELSSYLYECFEKSDIDIIINGIKNKLIKEKNDE